MKEIVVQLTSLEEQLVAHLRDLRGYREDEMLRVGMRLLYKKEFPTYTNKGKALLKSSERSPEEQCVIEGGTVIEKKGVKQCRKVRGELEFYSPL